MASSATKFMCLFLILSLTGQSMATEYIVGDTLGWVPGVNIVSWLLGKTFHVGDILHFNYPLDLHSVTQVDLAGYLACSASVTLFSDKSGSTSITLTKPGTFYFISTVDLDCILGLKLAVTVVV